LSHELLGAAETFLSISSPRLINQSVVGSWWRHSYFLAHACHSYFSTTQKNHIVQKHFVTVRSRLN